MSDRAPFNATEDFTDEYRCITADLRNPSQTLRTVIPAVTCLTLGCQIIFSSFFLSVLGLRRK